jgi:hypothetical protein
MLKGFFKILFVGLIILSIGSCERKSCNNVSCPQFQQCISGGCFCLDGYEGTDCAKASSDKYVGSYNVSENCYTTSPNFPSYTVYITNDPNYPNVITISPLFNLTYATAKIHTDQSNLGNIIEIPYQSQGGLTFQGDGSFDQYNNRMTLNLSYTYNGASYQCTHTFYKY